MGIFWTFVSQNNPLPPLNWLFSTWQTISSATRGGKSQLLKRSSIQFTAIIGMTGWGWQAGNAKGSDYTLLIQCYTTFRASPPGLRKLSRFYPSAYFVRTISSGSQRRGGKVTANYLLLGWQMLVDIWSLFITFSTDSLVGKGSLSSRTDDGSILPRGKILGSKRFSVL